MSPQERVRKAYQFLLEHALSNTSFSTEDLRAATGWTRSTVRVYTSKQWREVLVRQTDGTLAVRPDFERLTEEEFLQRTSQVHSLTGVISRPLKIFLCHGSEDKPAVRELYQKLHSLGANPWLDEEKLLPGQNWHREITKAVREADIVVICLSKRSVNKSGYVQREIKFALDVADEKPEGTIFLIPVKLEECHIPDRLRNIQWVNLLEKEGYQKLVQSLQLRANELE